MARSKGTVKVAFSARKKRPARVFLIAVLLILLYFAIFPYPLGRETVAVPAWAAKLPDPSAAGTATVATPAADAGAAAYPFRLGDVFGYVDATGNVLHVEKTLFGVTLGETGFVSYTRLGTDWILQGPLGERILSFSGNGYPMVSADGSRIFNVKSDLSGLREMDRTGELAWERDFPALMTSISLQGDFLLVGLLNGTVVLLNRQGSPVFQFAPAGSRIPVAFGAAVSANGELLAALTGIDPQRLTVLRKRGSGYGELARLVLSSDFRREARMAFSPDSRFLVVEGDRSACLFNPVSRGSEWLPLRGSLSGVAFPARGRLVALAARDGPLVDLQIVAPLERLVMKETFPARDLYAGSVDGQLLIGVDGRLLRIDVREM
jgi:hypothetical protein